MKQLSTISKPGISTHGLIRIKICCKVPRDLSIAVVQFTKGDLFQSLSVGTRLLIDPTQCGEGVHDFHLQRHLEMTPFPAIDWLHIRIILDC